MQKMTSGLKINFFSQTPVSAGGPSKFDNSESIDFSNDY
jgi:hypothetical protein